MTNDKEVIEDSKMFKKQLQEQLEKIKNNPSEAVGMLESFVNFVSKVEKLENSQINEHNE